jgi:hypothetical protein
MSRDEDLEDALAALAEEVLFHSHRHAIHDRALQDVLDGLRLGCVWQLAKGKRACGRSGAARKALNARQSGHLHDSLSARR